MNNRYYLVSVMCEISCSCDTQECLCFKERVKSFCMKMEHYPTKHDILMQFEWNHEGKPITILSVSELPNESAYNDFIYS